MVDGASINTNVICNDNSTEATISIDVACRGTTATIFVDGIVAVDVTKSIDVARNNTATLYIINVVSNFTVTLNNNVDQNNNVESRMKLHFQHHFQYLKKN